MKTYPLLLGLALLSACVQKGKVDEHTSYPPFEVHTQGTWSQAVWGPQEVQATHTVYYEGEKLALPGVQAGTAYPQFDWLQPLPGGRLLLSCKAPEGPMLGTLGYNALHQVRLVAGQPHIDHLGPCTFDDPRMQQEPDICLTPDSLGLLLYTPYEVGQKPPPPRIIDLAAPARAVPLPPDPDARDGSTQTAWVIRWSPDHQWLTRTYAPSGTGVELLDLVNLRTGRHELRHFANVTDSATTDTPFDQLYWQPVAGGYRLARRPAAPPHRAGRRGR